MISESATERDMRQRETLDRLMAARKLGRYATFFETGEGVFLPDGLEKMTGYVIDSHGGAHWFILDWDAERGAAALTEFKSVDIKPSWREHAEYRRACEKLGLIA